MSITPCYPATSYSVKMYCLSPPSPCLHVQLFPPCATVVGVVPLAVASDGCKMKSVSPIDGQLVTTVPFILATTYSSLEIILIIGCVVPPAAGPNTGYRGQGPPGPPG